MVFLFNAMLSVSHGVMRKKKKNMKKGGNQKKSEELISFSSEGHCLSGTEIPV